ncbi:MAG: SEC-C domain-containing protein [Deltaproteobacteria bacterium]|nr:SEC-C domain-containing protein [Deltaproteobacteria bacterium]
MELLSLRGCLRAIPSFIRILLERADVEIAFDQALEGLSRFGPAALEPLLAARASANTELQKGRLDRALASLGCKDERIYVVLLEALARKDELAPASLARYGDSRALQPLMVALDQRDLEESSDVPLAAGFEVTELVGAIRALGGVLSAEQGARVARVTQESEAQVRDYVDRATQEEARRSLGRNDLCWCGSRKKYKKCHLREDEAQRERPN